eukprot:6300393-Amphidinium_carterae.1
MTSESASVAEAASTLRARGVKCKCCGVTDSTEDPLTKKAPYKWAYESAGQTQGEVCFYCNKVYANCFRVRYPSVASFVQALGQAGELYDDLVAKRQFVIDEVLRVGKHSHVRCNWQNQSVSLKKKREIEVSEPVDDIYELSHYISLHGHPSSNGLGHKVVTLPGETQQSVLVPGAPVRKLKRRTVTSAELDTTIASGEHLEFGQKAGIQLQNDLFETFNMEKAVGATLNSLLAPAAATQPEVGGAGFSHSHCTPRKAGKTSSMTMPDIEVENDLAGLMGLGNVRSVLSQAAASSNSGNAQVAASFRTELNR